MGESPHRDRLGPRRHHPLRRRLCGLSGDLLPGGRRVRERGVHAVRPLATGRAALVRNTRRRASRRPEHLRVWIGRALSLLPASASGHPMAPDVPAPDLSNRRRGLPLVAVALAPRAFRVRVWQIMSRGQGLGAGRSSPEGAGVGYSPGVASRALLPSRSTLTRPQGVQARRPIPGVSFELRSLSGLWGKT